MLAIFFSFFFLRFPFKLQSVVINIPDGWVLCVSNVGICRRVYNILEISAHGTIRHRAFEHIHRASASERSAGLLRQTLVDSVKALSLRFQGNFAKRCFICLVYIAISLIKIYLRRYVTMYSLISKLETKFRSMFMHRKIRHFFSSFD